MSTLTGDAIGPGRLVLVVGPSGAGKDTLIAGARAACTDDATVVFPRRVVTRATTADEDHDTMTPEAFAQAAAAGRFALSWEAHGLRYGIPIAIDADIAAGRTVVVNVSRTIIALARRRYATVAAVEVTAPPEILRARLAGRDRRSDGALAERMARSAMLGADIVVDTTIRNVGSPKAGIQQLLAVIRA